MALLQKFLQTLKHTFSCNITDFMWHFWEINRHRSPNLWWRSAIYCGIQQKQQWKQCIAERIDNKPTSQIIWTSRTSEEKKARLTNRRRLLPNLVAITNIIQQNSDAITSMHSPISTISHNKQAIHSPYCQSELKDSQVTRPPTTPYWLQLCHYIDPKSSNFQLTTYVYLLIQKTDPCLILQPNSTGVTPSSIRKIMLEMLENEKY